MSFRAKLLSATALPPWRAKLRAEGKKLVVTNGVFDILHVGHATYLEAARNLGDVLLVGITCDAGVRELKGPSRPVNNETDRAALLGALESVSAVYIFPETTALKFLSSVEPDIYTKGGDYTLDTINQEERRLIEKMGGKIVILPGVEGKSTTATLNALKR